MDIKSITDPSFKKYGKIVDGIDFTEIVEYMKTTPCPDDVIYTPSIAQMENTPAAAELQYRCYGGMPIEIGYCNGNNYRLNAVEYHIGGEINIAVNDLVLILGCLQDVENGRYDTSKMELFRIPAGTGVMLYETTLHYAPCNWEDAGFRCVIVLPQGTNFDLDLPENREGEYRRLFAKNKWLIAHPETDLGSKGAWVGLDGENINIKRKEDCFERLSQIF